MSRRDIARERLKEIRTLQGWREAYKVAGLTPEGSDATKRRRLSRLINTKTSGAKKLDSKERRRINRTYRRREKKGTFTTLRSEKAVKKINRYKAKQRKKANKVFGRRGVSPDDRKLQRRLRQNADLTDEEIQMLEEAFARSEEDGGKSLRAEYAKHLSSIQLFDLEPAIRSEFERQQVKAQRAEWRDSGSTESFEDWVDERYG